MQHFLSVVWYSQLVIAGLIGIFGVRWMKSDIAAANEADRIARG